MPRSYSLTARRRYAETNAAEHPLVLLEITHPGLSAPVRVVGDTLDLVSNGFTYTACGFGIRLPDERQGQQPNSELFVDNIGRELMQWIEQSAGGQGARVRMMQVLRSTPDNIEWEITLQLTGLKTTPAQVSGALGFPRLLDVPAVQVRADPQTMPGIF